MNALPATGLLLNVVFVLCLLTLAIGALIAVLSTRLIRNVCGLAICCFGLAGLYYFLHSPFLALTELLIYVGAVCVTIVFAIMLAEPEEPEPALGGRAVAALSLMVVAALFGGLLWLGAHGNWSLASDISDDGSLQNIGRALLSTYSVAFELISLALLVAILGALAIARAGRSKA